ncbi:Cysteine rich repeat-containing protein [Aliiruegeria haliotis]|uniref:Cysteine rich repeat-containing protein n=1 Tax=Aliiruegeria haliotis TaxID=1280846 RepID=A0A2T0RLU3_9RHOB|nr:cysteine rich repeat-containing protein [Aliiruegeria haliotis]PRY22166.1 Cysteine rich repeat-containing protein [Aliiruegeria haliotis]
MIRITQAVLRLSAISCLVLTALVSTPEPAAANDIIGACETEIATFCAAVEPGHGRLAACLYAHENKLDAACDSAIGDLGDMLDLFFEEVRFLSQVCADDMTNLCAESAAEAGGHFYCLKEHQTELSPGCAAVVEPLRLIDD